MYFRILHDDTSGELTYLLADADAHEAVLVDPRGRDLPVLLALLAERELRLRWVLRTHHHDDLMLQEATLLAGLGAPVVQGQGGPANHQAYQEDDILPFGNELVRMLVTPGHTAGSLSFAWRDRLFCGGLLAVDACAHQPRPALPEALWDSVRQRVFTLPDETLLFTSHECKARAVSTVMEQRRWHPFFAGLSRDEFLAHMAALPEQVTQRAQSALTTRFEKSA